MHQPQHGRAPFASRGPRGLGDPRWEEAQAGRRTRHLGFTNAGWPGEPAKGGHCVCEVWNGPDGGWASGGDRGRGGVQSGSNTPAPGQGLRISGLEGIELVHGCRGHGGAGHRVPQQAHRKERQAPPTPRAASNCRRARRRARGPTGTELRSATATTPGRGRPIPAVQTSNERHEQPHRPQPLEQ